MRKWLANLLIFLLFRFVDTIKLHSSSVKILIIDMGDLYSSSEIYKQEQANDYQRSTTKSNKMGSMLLFSIYILYKTSLTFLFLLR